MPVQLLSDATPAPTPVFTLLPSWGKPWRLLRWWLAATPAAGVATGVTGAEGTGAAGGYGPECYAFESEQKCNAEKYENEKACDWVTFGT